MKQGMTRRTFIGAAVASTALLAGCNAGGNDQKAETDSNKSDAGSDTAADAGKLVVFAAASMTESLQKATDAYKASKDSVANLDVSFNFDSSGTLKTQIQEGADCDVFISAGQKQMNQLDAEDTTGTNTEGLDFIEPGTRFNILRNEVVLVVPEGNPKGIKSFDQLAELLASGGVLMAMGNSDVPVGQYTQKILAYYKLDEQTLANSGVITYGTNVKEVTSQVSEGAVDCGVVYKTDAVSAGLTIADTATKEMCGEVVYPAAAIKGAKNLDAAKDYLDFLKTAEASACFEEVGFTPLSQE